jgi:glutamate formiminotransferase/formiminotetrahydrofolate cyclodeaminase
MPPSMPAANRPSNAACASPARRWSGCCRKECLIDAGRCFLRKQQWSEGVAEEELIELAIRSMGLSELKPFDPREKVIEYRIEKAAAKSLVRLNLRQFCNET